MQFRFYLSVKPQFFGVSFELITTGIALFAKCLEHSAKALPSTTHSIPQTATKDSAKPSLPIVVYRALNKDLVL